MPQGSNEGSDTVHVVANRRKRRKRKGLTAAGREKFRQNALKHQPWRFSTGPRTPEGKRRSSQNGRYRQKSAMSRREVQLELGEMGQLLVGLAESRLLISNEE
jgi:hypothetical protein